MSDVADVNDAFQPKTCRCCDAVGVIAFVITPQGHAICWLCYYLMTGEHIGY